MNTKKIFPILLLIFTSISAGCNLPQSKSASSAEEQVDPVATLVAQTMAAYQSQLQQTQAYLDANPTSTSMPTLEIPAITQATVSTTTSYSQAGCLIAGKVSETIPDNSTYAPGEKFNKTWTVINKGSCPWTTNFQLVFLSGDQMGGTSPMNLSSNVPAGNFIDLTLDLTAPYLPGTYLGNWRLQTEDGTMITVFWVQIIVESD